MKKIIYRYGLVWGKHKIGHTVVLFEGAAKQARQYFNVLSRAGDNLLGDRIGFNVVRVWSDGSKDQACLDVRYK